MKKPFMKKEDLDKEYFEVSVPVKTCSICKKKFVGLGNNPQPVRTSGEDRCCDECDRSIVIPRRWKEVNKEIN